MKIIYTKNQGIVKTRNFAINQVKTKYIVQLDADDKIGKNFLEKSVPILEKNSNIGVVFFKTQVFGEKKEFIDYYSIDSYSLEKQLLTNQIVITSLFRKSDFKKTNGYSLDFEEGYEDWDFWLTLIEIGLEVKFIPEVEFYWRMVKNSRNKITIQKQKELRNKIWQNHKDLYLKNTPKIPNLLWKIHQLEELNKELLYFKNSKSYKLGHFFLWMFKLVKK